MFGDLLKTVKSAPAEPDKWKRDCPRCGRAIDLRLCRIVSTASGVASPSSPSGVQAADTQKDEWDSLPEEDEVKLESTEGDPSVLADPQRDWERQVARQAAAAGQRRGFLDHVVGGGEAPSGPPLVELGRWSPEVLPRRQCPHCRWILPIEMDVMRAAIVSVVGLNIAGKSNYLAVALHLARAAGMADYGIDKLVPAERTAQVFHTKYYLPVFRANSVIAVTQKDMRVADEPLEFKAGTSGGDQFLLVTHDISGELMLTHTDRAKGAGFVTRSLGVIFILDPTEFDQVRLRLPAGSRPPDRALDQADLLDRVLDDLAYRNVPVAVVVSKSDLLEPLVPQARFLHPRPQGMSVTDDLQAVSDDVKAFLQDYGQGRIVQRAMEYGHCTFHAVSALGCEKEELAKFGVNPLRVLDPLATVIRRLSARTAAT